MTLYAAEMSRERQMLDMARLDLKKEKLQIAKKKSDRRI
jgi:hypothetical protein